MGVEEGEGWVVERVRSGCWRGCGLGGVGGEWWVLKRVSGWC